MLLPLAATAASVGLAGSYAYAALSAGSQIFGRTLIGTPAPNEIALTFDDGPNDQYTMQLLDILDKYQVKATFFMIGRLVRQRPETVRAVQSAGHLVGNHTMTHPWLVLTSPPRVRQELAECNAALEDVLGEQVRYFRPPHGSRRPDVLRIARELSLTPVMWNVMAYDWKPENDAEKVVGYVQRGVARNHRAGQSSNILLHDGGQAGIGQDRSATVTAVSRLLPDLASAGTRFITVNEMSAARL